MQVCIFDDKIEVLSPGMLYGGLDMATVKMSKSRCRNEAVAEPLFEEFGDGIKVTIFTKVSSGAQKVSSTFDKYVPLLKEAEITDKFIEKVFIACGTDAGVGRYQFIEL